MRRSLRKRLPAAHELVYEYRDSFVISHSPSERGFEGVFAIRGSAEGVRLYFNRGKGLPDPQDFAAAKLGIFAASILAALFGTALLWKKAKNDDAT